MKQWDKIYHKEGKKYSSRLSRGDYFINFLKQEKIGRVLDVGCGSGGQLLDLAKRGYMVFGFDFSPQAIEVAQKRFSEAKFRGDFKVASMQEKFPYRDNFFDVVISLRTINHGTLPQIKKTIKEIKRVLKPSGIVFISSLYVPGRKVNFGVTTLNTLKVKMISPRTYQPLEGKEKGVTHYLFNKKILRNTFRDFKCERLWVDYGQEKWERYYCFLGRN